MKEMEREREREREGKGHVCIHVDGLLLCLSSDHSLIWLSPIRNKLHCKQERKKKRGKRGKRKQIERERGGQN